MGNLTIRNVPNEVIERLKIAAKKKGHSMEQEVRELLATRYRPKSEIIEEIRERWKYLPPTTAEELNEWRRSDRPYKPSK